MELKKRKSATTPLWRHVLEENPVPVAYRLSWVANFLTGPVYEEMEQRFGLTRPEFIILFNLVAAPGCTAQDVAEASGRPKNSISRAVNALLRNGLISRRIDDIDQRRRPLIVTSAGRRLYRQALPLFVTRERQMLAPLNEAERAEFDRLLRKLVFRTDSWAQTY
ncbi:MarR family transcriptional regulator [Bradyrhizobium sediminis]|uniref:MarR family transcriptional regulator n=1 Tax=Bradyrhizobium sediminis TaxID=2840469 RepID=A0A975RSY6_9BRAD|nr:MarR family transcriptional regulator [Bradyrhizobium sediminis]QWG18226.1 MarR family transcriptional regulator [Bradyrhizobium sediminis]